jgi:SAM-dependent methyltransferase
MKNKAVDLLVCPDCGGKLNLLSKSGNSRIFSCSCFKYPELFGILYLKRDNLAKLAVVKLEERDVYGALNILLNVRKKLLFPILLSVKFNIIKLVDFKSFIKILTFFSYDKNWAKYIIHREKSDYYKISVNLLKEIPSKNTKILDVGCGAGNFLSEIYKYIKNAKIVGIDNSFINLLFAKYFFSKDDTMLVCADVESEFWGVKRQFDLVHLNDTYQYIAKKENLLKSISKVLTRDGILALIHNHKIKMDGNILGIREKSVIKWLKNLGFERIESYSDNFFLLRKTFGIGFPRRRHGTDKDQDKDAYSIFASKSLNAQFFANTLDNIIFVSPHLDDAILSAGGLILELRKFGYQVKVITIFTDGGSEPYSQEAKNFLLKSGNTNSGLLFRARRQEDFLLMKSLGIKFNHLGFIDAAFRKDGKGNDVYNVERQFSGRISEEDRYLTMQIENKLRKIIKYQSPIFVPLGIGGHVDHQIVRVVTEKLPAVKIYWEDYPYNLKTSDDYSPGLSFPENRFFTLSDYDRSGKLMAIKRYKSQVNVLFPDNINDLIAEKYYSEIFERAAVLR